MEELKIAAATAAIPYVEDGMRLGIGTGSTAEKFMELLAERVEGGLTIVGIPTSERTAQRCTELGIPLSSLEETPELDLTVDGADEISPDLSLIKGAGGALLREKIVANASRRMIVIADQSKEVEKLGAFALPVEVASFGYTVTARAIERATRELGFDPQLDLREGRDGPSRTDGQNFVYDLHLRSIDEPKRLAKVLSAIPGVVEHGLFIDLADLALVADESGVHTIEPRAV